MGHDCLSQCHRERLIDLMPHGFQDDKSHVQRAIPNSEKRSGKKKKKVSEWLKTRDQFDINMTFKNSNS